MELGIRVITTSVWMDKLKLNDDKTELMIIESRQKLEKFSVVELSVGDTSVAPAGTARNLGVWFDPNLKFDAQITNLIQLFQRIMILSSFDHKSLRLNQNESVTFINI